MSVIDPTSLTLQLRSQVRKTVPDVAKENLPPFDYILVTTKNVPDVSPTVADIIEPAVTTGKTAIVLSQNGLNIEKPIVTRFPKNIIISSVSTIGCTERSHGDILHDDTDEQKIGPFNNPEVPQELAEAAARRYMEIYDPAGKLALTFEPNVLKTRWRKLVYNASFNTVATVLQMDTSRMRMSRFVVDELLKPIMGEIITAANAAGCDLDPDLPNTVIYNDGLYDYFHPSMMQDIEKGNYFELEVICGEPLREAEALGVPTPTLKVIYSLLKGLQLKTKEAKGEWKPRFTDDNPYGEKK